MNRLSICKSLFLLSAAATALLQPTLTMAETYRISVTNITRGMTFTPRLHAIHIDGNLFVLGEPALAEIATIAESGNVTPALELMGQAPELVTASVVGDGLLGPGESQEVVIEGNPGDLLSVIAMLIPTNDAFFAVNAALLPDSGSLTVMANVYDAGSEPNDELCSSIPGPTCGGAGDSPGATGEGFVHIHAGIHGVGDLEPGTYDWRNPGAKVTITHMP